MNRPSSRLITSSSMPYLLSVPGTSGESDAIRPLLCFLHGYDEGYPAPTKQALTRHGPLSTSSSVVATTEFMVVAPQMPVSGDFWHRYAETLVEMVRHIQQEYGGDPRRTFLTGFSFGGNGVFDLGLAQPEVWRALWPVDPTRLPSKEPTQPIWLSSGQVSRYCEERFVQRLHLERLRPEEVELELPGDRIYLDQMQDHVGTAALAYQDDRIYQWMLSR